MTVRRGGGKKKKQPERSVDQVLPKPKSRWHRLRDATNHEVVGGLVVALALGGGAWIATKTSCEPKPLQEHVAAFVEAREILKQNRGKLADFARHLHQTNSTLTSAYPVATFGPLIAPDEFWLQPEPMTPIEKLSVEWDAIAAPPNLSDFTFLNPPFTKDHGYSTNVDGYAKTIAELNAPNGRKNKFGEPVESNEEFEKWHRQFAARDARNIFDGDLYRATSYEKTDGGYRLKVAPSSYFEFTDSCEIFGYEIAEAIRSAALERQLRESRTANDWQQLGSRASTLEIRSRNWNIFDLSKRAVGIGVNVLLIRLDSSKESEKADHRFYFHDRRIGTASEAMGTLHVVPAGGFAPSRGVVPGSAGGAGPSIVDQIVNEMLDEFFSVNIEEKLRSTPMAPEAINPVAAEIYQRIRSGAWQMFLIGAGIDPLNLKLELCVALVAHCPRQEQILNSVEDPKLEGALLCLPFSRQNLSALSSDPICLPAAKVCLEWAVRNYDAITGLTNAPKR